MTNIDQSLKKLMSVFQINGLELARQTGVSQPIINRLCNGKNTNPKLKTITPLAEYFGVTVSQLIGEQEFQLDSPPIKSEVRHQEKSQ